MKAFIVLGLLFGTIVIGACASIYPTPPFERRIYHPCADDEAPDPKGKLCFSKCAKRSFFAGKCKEWETIVEDFNSEKFYEFRAAGFKMVVVK